MTKATYNILTMEVNNIHRLIDKYLNGQAAEEEIKLVEDWYASFENAPGLVQQLDPNKEQQAIADGFQGVANRLGLAND